MDINSNRLREDIETNAEFGEIDSEEGWGRTTLTGTDADKKARDHLVTRLRDAGLSIRIDPIGNIVGRWTPESADSDANPIAVGSHLDSVPEGGIFDGPLGTYGALESVRAIQESTRKISRPIEVVSFTEEEGVRFKNGLLGSSVVCGIQDLETARGFTDDEGITVGEELDRIGYAGSDRIDASDWHAWAELHIEQDTKLEDSNSDVGIIEAIAGLTNCRVEFIGEPNHAGATPMNARRDSLAAASECVLSLEEITLAVVETRSDTAVGTIGEIHVTPNAKNVIAGKTDLIIDVRDVDKVAIDYIIAAVQKALQEIEETRNVSVTFDQYRYTHPQAMNDACIETAVSAAIDQDIDYMRMHSPALHDTANVATVTDTVMLFAPSKNGISHNPREWTDWEDCSTAVEALSETVWRLAQ